MPLDPYLEAPNEFIREQGDPQTRLLVVEQLGKMAGNERALEILADMRDNDPDRIVKYKARKTLASLEAPADQATP